MFYDVYEIFLLLVLKSYEATERHTYCAMAVTSAYVLVLLVSLLVCYKSLSPVPKTDDRGVSSGHEINLELREILPQVYYI